MVKLLRCYVNMMKRLLIMCLLGASIAYPAGDYNKAKINNWNSEAVPVVERYIRDILGHAPTIIGLSPSNPTTLKKSCGDDNELKLLRFWPGGSTECAHTQYVKAIKALQAFDATAKDRIIAGLRGIIANLETLNIQLQQEKDDLEAFLRRRLVELQDAMEAMLVHGQGIFDQALVDQVAALRALADAQRDINVTAQRIDQSIVLAQQILVQAEQDGAEHIAAVQQRLNEIEAIRADNEAAAAAIMADVQRIRADMH